MVFLQKQLFCGPAFVPSSLPDLCPLHSPQTLRILQGQLLQEACRDLSWLLSSLAHTQLSVIVSCNAAKASWDAVYQPRKHKTSPKGQLGF